MDRGNREKKTTNLAGQNIGVTVNVLEEPSFRGLVHLADPASAQVLAELGQGAPTGGVHVQVLLVTDVLLVHGVGQDSPSPKPRKRKKARTRTKKKKKKKKKGEVGHRAMI